LLLEFDRLAAGHATQDSPGFQAGMKTGDSAPKTGEKSTTWKLDRGMAKLWIFQWTTVITVS